MQIGNFEKNSKLFEYEYETELFENYPNKNNISNWLPPTPQNVKSWIAYDDLLITSKLGQLFGRMFTDKEIDLDIKLDSEIGEGGSLETNPTIAMGLGFTNHTKTLYGVGNFNEKNDKQKRLIIGWDDITDTDYFIFKEFDGKKHIRELSEHNESYDHSFALIIRFKLDIHAHFICAGLTASGTAAAGRYLAEKWDELYKLYNRNGHRHDISNESLAVLLKHPKEFGQVRGKKIDNIQNSVIHDYFFFNT